MQDIIKSWWWRQQAFNRGNICARMYDQFEGEYPATPAQKGKIVFLIYPNLNQTFQIPTPLIKMMTKVRDLKR
jgi:hypothetical protein